MSREIAQRAVAATIRLRVPAGGARPAPPVGPALGQYRLNLMAFCKDFNARTQKYKPDTPIAVTITAYKDNTFEFTVKSPSVTWFLKKAAGIELGSGRPGHLVTSTVTVKHIYEIAKESDIGIIGLKSPSNEKSGYLPVLRSGSSSDIGPKQNMEDEYICTDNFHEHFGAAPNIPSPGAFYGVFDGHGGVDAASFTRNNILKYIVGDANFPVGVKKAVKSAFAKADHAFADASSLDRSSGTTALIALILGSTMLVANAGDSRAVLGKRGRAVELSKDHKPNCTSERLRIEKLGGVIYDGYLNGQLSVARALGDWHMKGPKGSSCPLSSEPELQEIILTDEDEFLILGCDGLWDVMSSQCAVTMTRKELMSHNDPEKCSKELVREALKRNSCDNLTVVVVCFSPEPPPRIEIPKSQRRRSISAEGLDLLKGVLNTNI